MENLLYPDASSHVEDYIITPEELYIHLIFFIKKNSSDLSMNELLQVYTNTRVCKWNQPHL